MLNYCNKILLLKRLDISIASAVDQNRMEIDSGVQDEGHSS